MGAEEKIVFSISELPKGPKIDILQDLDFF